MSWETKKRVSCHVETTLAVIDGRWKVMILYHLFDGMQRFNALQRLLGGITPRTLALQLKDLESHGLVNRHAYAEIPPRVEYRLTPLGQSLKPVLKAMHDWGRDHAAEVGSEPA